MKGGCIACCVLSTMEEENRLYVSLILLGDIKEFHQNVVLSMKAREALEG